MRARNPVTRWLKRLSAKQADLDTEEIRARSHELGVQDLCDVVHGDRVTLFGRISAVTFHPKSAPGPMQATYTLQAGHGNVEIVFLGRQRIAGLEAGRSVTVTGRLLRSGGRPTIYNPEYALHPTT